MWVITPTGLKKNVNLTQEDYLIKWNHTTSVFFLLDLKYSTNCD